DDPARRAGAIELLLPGAGAWIAGMVVRSRRADTAEVRQRALRLEREQEEHARQVAAQERLRIARELHDIVAHKLSIIVGQAQAATLMATVEETGRGALEEMRRLLGVLRPAPDSTDTDPRPQPRLADIDNLIGEVRAAGLPVTLTRSGQPIRLTDAVDLSAYR